MNQQANVLSIDALADLKNALNRFRADGEAALTQAERELQRTLDWLHERVNHWQTQVRQRQEELRRAQAELSRCQNSGYTDRNGNYHPPDCRRQETALQEARAALRAAEAELQNTIHWGRTVQQAGEAYQAQARSLSQHLNGELPKATALLENKIAVLQSYVAMSAPPVTISSSAGEPISLSLDPSALQPLTPPPDPSLLKAETIENRAEEYQLAQQLADGHHRYELGQEAQTAGEVLSAGAFGLAPTAEAFGTAIKNTLDAKISGRARRIEPEPAAPGPGEAGLASNGAAPAVSRDSSFEALAGIPGESANQMSGFVDGAMQQLFGSHGNQASGNGAKRSTEQKTAEGSPGGPQRQ